MQTHPARDLDAAAPDAPSAEPTAPVPAEPQVRVLSDAPAAMAHLRAATSRIAPVWQLEHFVAVNPYLGLVDLRVEDAAERLELVAGAQGTLPVEVYLDHLASGRIGKDDLAAALAASTRFADQSVEAFLAAVEQGDTAAPTRVRTVADVATELTGVDWGEVLVDRVAGWAAAYFDGGQAMWSSADGTAGLFSEWRFEASVDRTPKLLGLRGFRRAVQELPEDAGAAAAAALDALGVDEDALELYLHALLMRVGGWAAFAGRRGFEAQLAGGQDDTLAEFLAVLVCWESLLLAELGSQGVAQAWAEARADLAQLPHHDAAVPVARRWVLQDAFDRAEQRRLVERLAAPPAPADAPVAPERPDVQAVFCIDVRSEVFRRHLESVTPGVETLGFAGFFGVAVEFRQLGHDSGVDQCPVLLLPGHTVTEVIPDTAQHAEAVERRSMAHHVRRAWKSFKMGAISCFSFVGPVGLIYLPKLFTDGFGRTRPVPRAETEGLGRDDWTALQPSLEPVAGVPGSGISLEDRVALATGALRGMSLTEGLAPLVVLCGHGANTVNNPYDNGLACGACGGHTGESNARVTAMILNDPAVRAALAADGLQVPSDTWFVAALHDTTTDEFSWFDLEAVPASHQAAVEQFRSEVAVAGGRTRAERSRRLSLDAGGDVDTQVLARSRDWAQVRPEWGLAGCSAFVAAPRERTRGVDLAGRSFLHSYDWRADQGFAVLELIMTAPMVVASWINLQYYASTVDNRLFGSGNKTLHNVVGKVGVLEGTGGDLRTGLPWQSVHDGVHYQHEPLRLNVVIEAPRDAMNDVIARHPGVRDLLDHGWVHLLAMDDSGAVSHRYAGDLRWESIG